jgi:hypothetical protein
MPIQKGEFNHTESDARDMTPEDKGRILLLAEQGKKPKEIAGITKFSMNWIKLIINTLFSWRNKHELIDAWLERQQREEGKGDRYTKAKKRKAICATNISDKSATDGDNDIQRITKGTAKPRKNTDKTKSGRRRKSVRRSVSGGHSVVDSMRKHKDYKGE